jgi:hypothetical protein
MSHDQWDRGAPGLQAVCAQSVGFNSELITPPSTAALAVPGAAPTEYRRCQPGSTLPRAGSIRNHAMSAKPQPLDFVARTAAASAAMAVSQRVEMALTHRPGSKLPVRVVEALIGRGLPTGAQAVAGQFAQATLAALALGSAEAAHRIPIVPAIALNIVVLVSANAVVARALGLGDVPWKWSFRDIATDLTHKTTLAIAATTLGRRRKNSALTRPASKAT